MLAKAKAESKKLVKKDKLNHIECSIEELNNLPSHKMYHAALKKLKAKPKAISWGIKDINGAVLTNKDKILERWAKFYEELYFDHQNQIAIDDSTSDEIQPILKDEISSAINNLKNEKSPGLVNIYSEYIKSGGEHLINALHHLFNCILTTGKIPQLFKEALIFVIYKKVSRLDCGNYRPISLLSHVYKLFVNIIATRTKADLYASFPETQAAYQPGRGTIEQILALEQIIEKSIEFNNPVHITFIDFKKAFDSVKLSSLWMLLDKTSINKKYINLLKQSYENSNAYIKTEFGTSRCVDILKGVKQGDVLSAILFCIVIAALVLQVENECTSGFSIGGHTLSNLSYADDIAVISNSRCELQIYLHPLAKYAAEVGLKINVSKTKCMTTDKINTNLHLTIDNNKMSQVTEFIYLGHKLSSKNDGLVAVQHRIGLGWAAFNKNKAVLTSKRVSYHLKSKIFNTYVIPVVLYGLECVNWTSKSLQKLVVFQNHMMRFMTNKRLSDHTRIEDLLRTTKLTPITSTIKSKVLKLYGHTKRPTQGVSRICLEGMIEGRRSRGRQPKRWRDNISHWTGRNLMSLNTAVKDRNLWRQLAHVDAQADEGGEGEL